MELSPDVLRVAEVSPGFELRPILLRGRAQAEAFVAALRAAGHPTELCAPKGSEWHAFLEHVRRPGGSLAVYGEAPIAGSTAGAFAGLNRQRDVITRARPHILWWCGSEAFLNATALAMPDFWSIRAPTLHLDEAEPPAAAVAPAAPLMPQTEKDIRAFARWLVQTFGEGTIEWSEPGDAGEEPHAVPLDDEEALVAELRRMVPEPRRLFRLGEVLWDVHADFAERDAARTGLLDHLARLGGLREDGPGAEPHVPYLWDGFYGPLLVPFQAPLTPLRCRDGAGEISELEAIVADPKGRRMLLVPSEGLVQAATTALAWEFWAGGGYPIGVPAGSEHWFEAWQSLPTAWHARAGDAALFVSLDDASADSSLLRNATELPTIAVLRADLDPGPLEGWERYWLLPPDDAEAHALIEAWLPEETERDALLEFLHANPRGDAILHDLGRLLPLLHSLTPLPLRAAGGAA